jgi:hypothetical protein
MQAKKEQRAQKLEMIRDWQQSGTTQRAFCIDNNIAYHVFHYWYGVYRSEQKDTGLFVPINITPAVNQDRITITGINGIQLKVPLTDQSIRFIKQLLLC